MDPNLGTREEDWPEVDVDSDTEEGAEAMRRAEASMHATIERSIRQRNAQPFRHTNIPQALYGKAQDQQDHLTAEERQLLLSRGDVVGKALAYPDSLTADEMHQALLWPPPAVVHANIRHATGGSLSTPSELFAKGKDAVDRGQFGTMLNEDEIALLARYFHATDDAGFSDVAMSEALAQPGTAQAVQLLSSRLGLEFAVFHAALRHRAAQMDPRRRVPPAFPGLGPAQSLPLSGLTDQVGQRQQPVDIIRAMTSLAEQHDIGNVTDEEVAIRNRDYINALQAFSQPLPLVPPRPPLSHADLSGSGPWPPISQPRGPMNIFANDAHLSGHGVEPGWSALPDDQKEAYRARSETLRREAWAEHETALAEGTSPFPPSSRSQPRPANSAGLVNGEESLARVPAGSTTIITGLKLFHDELGVGFHEALERWDALTEEQRQAYKARAVSANAAARATRRQARNF